MTESGSPDCISLTIRIQASTNQVWALLTEPEGIERWYAFGGAEVDLRVGGRVSFRWDEHGTYLGVIEAVQPCRVFAFRFAPHDADVEPTRGNSTLVEIVLTPEGEGTQLRLTDSDYLSLHASPAARLRHQSMNEGAWNDSLHLLKELAESAASQTK